MTTLTLSNPTQIPSLVARTLGFEPTDSLVIVGLGGGPTARVDLDTSTDLTELAQALAPAMRHWEQVIVVVYGPAITKVEPALDLLLPGLTVVILAHVADGFVHDLTHDQHQPYSITTRLGVERLDGRFVAKSREVLIAEAGQVLEPSEAEANAIAAYDQGDGASAWVYLDRAVALRGSPSTAMQRLAEMLSNADRPPGM